MRPPSVTTIFAPGWRGAERSVATTVATAACSPAASAASMASRMSRIGGLGYPGRLERRAISPPRRERPAARSARR